MKQDKNIIDVDDDYTEFEIDTYFEDWNKSGRRSGKRQTITCDNCGYVFDMPRKTDYIPICPICGSYIDNF